MARRALGPATLAAVQAVDRALGDQDRALLVACSGGTDSSALAVATLEVARRRSLPVSALVVDHELQPDSARAAAAAQGNLMSIGLRDAQVVAVSVAQTAAGPEADARHARYAALERAAAERRATVLLGHTLDDQAETVLLGLARGSGPRSIAGMSARRGRLVRPFLGLRRSATAAVCAEAHLEPWSDPHNADPAFARVRVRTRVLPVLEAELGPGVAEALARTANLVREDVDVLDDLAARAAEPTPDGHLECSDLVALAAPIRRRVLRRWLVGLGVADLQSDHLGAVDRLVTDWHGQRWIEVPGAVVQRVEDRLVCHR
jgi:tRNA(Ile)-lysidine synthase